MRTQRRALSDRRPTQTRCSLPSRWHGDADSAQGGLQGDRARRVTCLTSLLTHPHLCRRSGVMGTEKITRKSGAVVWPLARSEIARRACEILAELYPGTRWEARSPDVRSRLETAPAAGELELLGAAPDDARAILGGKVARPASGGADKHRLDAGGEQAA